MLNRLNSKIRVLLFMFELRLLTISRLIFTSMNWNCRKKIGKTSANFLLERLNSHSMSRHQQKCRDTKFQKFPQCRDIITTLPQCRDIRFQMLQHRKYTRAHSVIVVTSQGYKSYTKTNLEAMSRHQVNVATLHF